MILTESSLQRIWSKTQEFECVMISAFRDGLSHSDNKGRSRKLLQQLLSLGYSCTKVRGGYVEKTSDGDKEVTEESYFVTNQNNDAQFLHNLKKLGMKYDQDSILIITKQGKEIYLYGTNNSEFPGKNQKHKLGTASYGSITSEYFTKVGGRAFEFKQLKESVNYDHNLPSTAKGLWCKKMIQEQTLTELSKIELGINDE